MLIDYHTHIGIESEHYKNATEFVEQAKKMRTDEDASMDVNLDAYQKAMEPVDKVIVLAFRSTFLGFNVTNDYVAEFVHKNPRKYIGLLAVDPHEPDFMDELERAYFDLGLKGIKLSPIYQGFHPTHERAMRIYSFAERNRLPILIHQGATFPREAPLKYAHPEMLEDIAIAFPDLRMIIAHLGHPWETETIVLIRKHPHVYSDVSGLYYRPWQFYNSLRLCQEYGVMDKLFFGSDYPVTTPNEALDGVRNVNHFLEGTKFPRISEEEIEKIIYRDKLAELGLE